MSDLQVKKCEEMFERKVKSSNPIYLAWKALKIASLPTEKEAMEAVLQLHSPKNIQKRKAHSGRKVPEGLSRFNLLSDEWKEIMEESADKQTKKKTPSKKSNASTTTKKAAPTKKAGATKKAAPSKKAAPTTRKATVTRKANVTKKKLICDRDSKSG